MPSAPGHEERECFGCGTHTTDWERRTVELSDGTAAPATLCPECRDDRDPPRVVVGP